MAYRNKVYVCFDADSDMREYNLLKAWDAHEGIDFDFFNAHDINNLRDGSSEQTIKRKLRERMKNSKMLVVLVGEKTKNLYKYVRWEIEIALDEYKIPVVVVNLNKERQMDASRCPAILRERLAIHVGYYRNIIAFAIRNWGAQHAQIIKDKQPQAPYYYPDSTYKEVGVKL